MWGDRNDSNASDLSEGYTVMLDGDEEEEIAANGRVTFWDVAEGALDGGTLEISYDFDGDGAIDTDFTFEK